MPKKFWKWSRDNNWQHSTSETHFWFVFLHKKCNVALRCTEGVRGSAEISISHKKLQLHRVWGVFDHRVKNLTYRSRTLKKLSWRKNNQTNFIKKYLSTNIFFILRKISFHFKNKFILKVKLNLRLKYFLIKI